MWGCWLGGVVWRVLFERCYIGGGGGGLRVWCGSFERLRADWCFLM